MLNDKSYDGIIKQFSTVMTDLSLLMERMNKKRFKMSEQIMKIEEQRDDCIEEQQKASKTLIKLREIFGEIPSNG